MSDTLWPEVDTDEQFHAVRRDEARLGLGVAAICRVLGHSGSVSRFAEGSLPVYALGEHQVLKLYPPVYLDEFERENLVLSVLAGKLPIPTPTPIAGGEIERWGYLLMDRLEGESLSSAWPDVPSPLLLMDSLGRALRALHEIRDPRLAPLHRGWPTWIVEQAKLCVERQRARGLDERWLEQIPAFLDTFMASSPSEGAHCLLHTEVMREHLMVSAGGTHLSGLFDFEPAMMGPPEYELASVGLFVSGGDPELLRRLLLAYGYPEDALGPELSERILAYALLHRYSNLPWYLRRVSPGSARTLSELALVWYGTTPLM